MRVLEHHIIPVDDLKPHIEFGERCHCHPRVETVEYGHKIVVHNAYDWREFFEDGGWLEILPHNVDFAPQIKRSELTKMRNETCPPCVNSNVCQAINECMVDKRARSK